MIRFFRTQWKPISISYFFMCKQGAKSLTIGQYSFRPLSQSHSDEAIALIGDQFTKREPLSNAYYLQFPLRQMEAHTDWRDYLNSWLSFPSTFDLSICVVDILSNEVVGVSLGHDAAATPTKVKEETAQSGLSYVLSLQNRLNLQIQDNLRPLFSTSGKVTILEAAALKATHTGRGLLPILLRLQEEIAAFYEYRYTYSLATNVKSERCFSQLGYTKVSQIDVEQFEMDGIIPFRLVDSLNKHPSTWIKRLEKNIEVKRGHK